MRDRGYVHTLLFQDVKILTLISSSSTNSWYKTVINTHSTVFSDFAAPQARLSCAPSRDPLTRPLRRSFGSWLSFMGWTKIISVAEWNNIFKHFQQIDFPTRLRPPLPQLRELQGSKHSNKCTQNQGQGVDDALGTRYPHMLPYQMSSL